MIRDRGAPLRGVRHLVWDRGRDGDCSRPPVQISARGTTALGSYPTQGEWRQSVAWQIRNWEELKPRFLIHDRDSNFPAAFDGPRRWSRSLGCCLPLVPHKSHTA